MRMPVVALVAVLPIFFIALGLWETARARATHPDAGGFASASTERFEPAAPPGPRPAPGATSATDDEADVAGWSSTVATWRQGLAWTTLGSGALALGAGWGGLLLVARSARRGLRSREELVSGFATVSRLLPPLLAVQILALVSATVSAVAFEIGALWFLRDPSERVILLAAVALFVAGLVLWAAWEVLRDLRGAWRAFVPRPMDVVALPLTRAQAPGLFALLQSVAAERGAAAPRTVAVGAEDGFFVAGRPLRFLLPNGEAQTAPGPALHLSLPLLAVLDGEELRAVLAHELAHFAGEDTAYGLRFAPLFSALGEAAVAMSERRTDWGGTRIDRLFEQVVHPHTALAVHAYERFDHAAMHWSRQRELEADRAAVSSSSASALAGALLRIGLAYDLLRAERREAARHPQAVPDRVASLVARMGTRTAADVAPHLADTLPHPSDSHPSTRSRIEATGVPIGEALLRRAARPVAPEEASAVRDLFADWDGLEGELDALLQGRAARALDERRARLAQAVQGAADEGEGEGESAVYPSLRRPVSLLSLAGLPCLAFWAGCVWAAFHGGPQDQESRPLLLGAAGFFALMLAFVLWSALRLWRGRHRPYLVFDRSGLRSPGFAGTIRWADVQLVGGSALGRPSLWVQIRPEARIPEPTGAMRRMAIDGATRSVQFHQLFPRGIANAALRDRLLAHARSAHAERLLEQLGPGPLPPAPSRPG